MGKKYCKGLINRDLFSEVGTRSIRDVNHGSCISHNLFKKAFVKDLEVDKKNRQYDAEKETAIR